jgi:hypothetical protein
MRRPVITLTTDFGQSDGYVAAMKGVLLSFCPDAAVVDVSHQVPPQSIIQGAYVLSTIPPYFPAGTIHLAVVDPGVGGGRRAVAVRSARATYVAPDNGLLSLALAADPPQDAVLLEPGRGWAGSGPISATFHGRDLFAPAAARLACGAHLPDLGTPLPLDGLVRLAGLEPEHLPDGSWQGQVLHVDHFGNLITSFTAGRIPGAECSIRVGPATVAGLRPTFSAVAPGELLAYVGSSGHLEIAVRDGSAAARLNVKPGDPVFVEFPVAKDTIGTKDTKHS